MRVIEVVAIAATSLFLLQPTHSWSATLPHARDAAPVIAASPQTAVAETPSAAVAAPLSTPNPAATVTEAEVKAAEPAKPAPPSLIAKVNLTTQTMTVLANGKAIHTWKVSSGAAGYETPVGTFKPDWMAKIWYSKQYDDAPMPHAVFFKNGAAIHATTSIGRLGTAASHGCVRLSPTNAETFYKLVTRHGLAMTRVAVSGRAAVREDRIARREDSRSTGGERLYQANQVQRIASRSQTYANNTSQFTYPGDRSRYPSGSFQVSRTPYWAR